MKMFIVYVWMAVAYNGEAVRVGEFKTCDEGVAVANELYKGYVALHCIMPEYQPPGGVKNVK